MYFDPWIPREEAIQQMLRIFGYVKDSQPSSSYNFSREVPFYASVICKAADYCICSSLSMLLVCTGAEGVTVQPIVFSYELSVTLLAPLTGTLSIPA